MLLAIVGLFLKTLNEDFVPWLERRFSGGMSVTQPWEREHVVPRSLRRLGNVLFAIGVGVEVISSLI